MLVECAWIAIRKKDSYLRSKYYKLIPRMGKKKAIVVIAHKILIACYYMLRGDIEYQDLGASYLEKNNKNKLIKHYTKKLTSLGFTVTVDTINEVA